MIIFFYLKSGISQKISKFTVKIIFSEKNSKAVIKNNITPPNIEQISQTLDTRINQDNL